MKKKNKVIPKKKYGQNFLKDQDILSKIISGAELSKDDVVVEIGPGQGALTKYLANEDSTIYCIEIDRGLETFLDRIESDYDNVSIIYDDFLKIDFKEFLKERDISTYKVVANLPYYITTPILMKLYEEGGDFDSITVMVQKEVGERLLSDAGSKDYGALTVLTRQVCDTQIVCEVPNTAFYPVPKVDSVVIKLTRNDNEKKIKDLGIFKKLVKAAFFNRRKKMINSVLNSGLLNINKEAFIDVLEDLGINTMVRGEKLDLDQFIELSNAITEL